MMNLVLHTYDLSYGYLNTNNGVESSLSDNSSLCTGFVTYNGNRDSISLTLNYENNDDETPFKVSILFYNSDKEFLYSVTDILFNNSGDVEHYTSSNLTTKSPAYLRLCIRYNNNQTIEQISIINTIEIESEYYFYIVNGSIRIKGIPEIPSSDIKPKGAWSTSPYSNKGLPSTNLMIPQDVKLPECSIPNGSWRIDSYINDGLPYTKLMTGLSTADLDVEYPFIELFDNVRVISPPHGLNKLFPVSKITIPLNNPEETEYTLTNNFKNNTLSATSNKTNQELYAKIMAVPDKSTILNTAKENSSNLIKMATNGYVTLVQDENGGTLEIVISNEPDYLQAQNVWRWNVNGLGFSSTGYNGEFGTAITMDGAIVADRITAGTMFADRIRGGTLVLGGYDNVNGVCKVVNENEETICELNCTGAYIRGQIDSYNINNGLVCRMHNGRFSVMRNDDQVGFIDGTYIYEGSTNPSIYMRSNEGIILSSGWVGVTDSNGLVYSTNQEVNIEVVTNVNYNSDGKVTGVTKKTLSFMKGLMMS